MSLMDEVGGILRQYAGGGTAPQQDPVQQYQQVATQAPSSALASAIGAVFRSPQTGSFGQNLGSLFGQSDPNQRAGILNMLLTSGAAGEILSKLGLQPGTRQVSAQQAQQISPAAVEEAAGHAEQKDPSIIDRASEFYSHHPTLVGALGAGAAVMALQHLAKR